MSNVGFVEFKNSKLFYRKYGAGQKYVLAFHGYGLDSNSWSDLSNALGTEYCVFAFDLWFHGESVWNEKKYYLTKIDLSNILISFLDIHKISNFSLAGFSLGGKFCLSIYEVMPDKVNDLLLIAPDGIKTSFWYNLAVYPIFFQNLLKRMIFYPGIFHRAVKIIRFFRLVDEGLVRFADKRMKRKSQRARVYLTWITYKKIKPDLKKISAMLNNNCTSLVIVTGTYDRIIKIKNFRGFLSRIENFNSIQLATGHNDLIEKYCVYLIESKA